jgi:hypothetical protein
MFFCLMRTPLRSLWQGTRCHMLGGRTGSMCMYTILLSAWRVAAPPCLGQQAPDATTTHLQSLLRQEMLDAACTVGATSLPNITLHVLLQLLISRSVGAGRAAKPLVITTT